MNLDCYPIFLVGGWLGYVVIVSMLGVSFCLFAFFYIFSFIHLELGLFLWIYFSMQLGCWVGQAFSKYMICKRLICQ